MRNAALHAHPQGVTTGCSITCRDSGTQMHAHRPESGQKQKSHNQRGLAYCVRRRHLDIDLQHAVHTTAQRAAQHTWPVIGQQSASGASSSCRPPACPAACKLLPAATLPCCCATSCCAQAGSCTGGGMCGRCCLLTACWLRPARPPAAGGASSAPAAAFLRLATPTKWRRSIKMRLGGSSSSVSSCRPGAMFNIFNCFQFPASSYCFPFPASPDPESGQTDYDLHVQTQPYNWC